MFKKSAPLFLYTETSLHVGSGQSLGAVDLAIQRERHTGIPVIPGSGIKGALRHWFEGQYGSSFENELSSIFGPPTDNAGSHAGAVAFTDARLLLFPMRSVKGVIAWVTCPTVLQRFKRDLAASGTAPEWTVPDVPPEAALHGTGAATTIEGHVMLDEHVFEAQQDANVDDLARFLSEHALPGSSEYAFFREKLPQHLVLLSDDAFRDFTQQATEVQARIKIDEETGTTSGDSGNLFYQENLPPESVLYGLVLAQDDLSGTLADGSAESLLGYVQSIHHARVQIGGDASIGKGRVCMRLG